MKELATTEHLLRESRPSQGQNQSKFHSPSSSPSVHPVAPPHPHGSRNRGGHMQYTCKAPYGPLGHRSETDLTWLCSIQCDRWLCGSLLKVRILICESSSRVCCWWTGWQVHCTPWLYLWNAALTTMHFLRSRKQSWLLTAMTGLTFIPTSIMFRHEYKMQNAQSQH